MAIKSTQGLNIKTIFAVIANVRGMFTWVYTSVMLLETVSKITLQFCSKYSKVIGILLLILCMTFLLMCLAHIHIHLKVYKSIAITSYHTH